MEKVAGFDIEEFKRQYSGLENAPLEVWIAEFLRRNKEFRKDCDEAWKYPPAELLPEEKLRKYGVNVGSWHLERPGLLPEVEVILEPPVRGVRIEKKGSNPIYDEIWNRMFSKGEPKDVFLNFLLDQKVSPKYVLSYLLGEPGVGCLPEADKNLINADDKLLLAVDLRRTPAEIKKLIEEFLEVHLPQPESRRHFDVWLRYLMVYDLRHMKPNGKKLTFEQIRAIVVKAIKHNIGMKSENDASRDYKICEALIREGYKRHL